MIVTGRRDHLPLRSDTRGTDKEGAGEIRLMTDTDEVAVRVERGR